MVAMASDVKLDLSMRITRHGHHAQVAFAAEVSGVAALPCAVDGYLSTVGTVCTGTRAEKIWHRFSKTSGQNRMFSPPGGTSRKVQ
ncbi:hypothetical protein D3C80_1994000 [compost metagenome]